MAYREVRYNNKDSVKVVCYRGTYMGYKVSILYGSDHHGWLFYIEKGSFYFNSMRKGVIFSTKDEAIMEAEKMIDERSRK